MWKEENDQLSREFTFKDFSEAFAFITRVGLLAEKHDHHPAIYNMYNKVTIKLQTHSAGNKVTEKDHSLAADIDKLFT
jgi:4a-hydroxytetrahydrobiopterin dehydratase